MNCKRYVPVLLLVLSLASCGKKKTAVKLTGLHSATLSWAASPTAGVQYHVYRDSAVVGSTAASTYTDSSLPPSTSFSYQVTSFCVTCSSLFSGESVPSNTVSVTTPPDATAITVTIAPTTVSLQTGKTQQFAATTTNTAITWSATAGTITSAGLFTAPSTTGIVTVKATAVADPTISASATVTVTALPQSGFNSGDRVKVKSTANVRSTAPVSGLGTLMGTMSPPPAGATSGMGIGTVTAVPQVPNTGGWIWVQVKFDACTGTTLIAANCTGYVGSDNLALVSTPPPPPPLTLTCVNNVCTIGGGTSGQTGQIQIIPGGPTATWKRP